MAAKPPRLPTPVSRPGEDEPRRSQTRTGTRTSAALAAMRPWQQAAAAEAMAAKPAQPPPWRRRSRGRAPGDGPFGWVNLGSPAGIASHTCPKAHSTRRYLGPKPQQPDAPEAASEGERPRQGEAPLHPLKLRPTPAALAGTASPTCPKALWTHW